MHLDRLLKTETGKAFVSILLGLGLASLFRKEPLLLSLYFLLVLNH